MKARIFRTVIATVLCLLFIIPTLPLPTAAEEPLIPNTSAAQAAVFYHVESGTALISQNADTPLPAGSTVKVMSGLLFCEILKDNLYDTVTVTDAMIGDFASNQMNLQAGDTLTVVDLLYAAICGSQNVAFHALATLSAPSVEQFVAKMNTRATELGLTKTSFHDPIGIKDNSTTTANDLLKIATVAYQNAIFMQICGTKSEYYIPTIGYTVKNRNEMIYGNLAGYVHYNEKCNGMSAGSTSLGGDCIVASASDGKDSYLCVLLNCGDCGNDQRYNMSYILADTLIEWVYSTYTYMEVLSPETVVCTIPVTVSDMTTEVNVVPREQLFCYVPSTVEVGKEITYSIRLTHTSLEAPVAEGQFVGYVAVLYNGKILGTVPLYTAGTAERSGFVSRLMSIQALTQNRKFISGAIFFLVLLTAWITTEILLSKHRRRRWDKYFSNKLDMTKRNGPNKK